MIFVIVMDIVGNIKILVELWIEIDMQVQIDSVMLIIDSGVNDYDNVINVICFFFEIVMFDDVILVLVFFDGVNWMFISKNVVGQWEFIVGSVLFDGYYIFYVQVMDWVGNMVNFMLGFIVDMQIDGLSVVMLDDVGKDFMDGIMNIIFLCFEILVRELLQSVMVILNGKFSILIQGVGNKWLFIFDILLVDGIYKIEIVVEDIVGNKISKEVLFIIDIIVFDFSIDLLDVDDIGESVVDNIMSVIILCFVIGNVFVDIDIVVIRINGVFYLVMVNGNNFWEFQVFVVLNDGVYEVVVVFRDIVGNIFEIKLFFIIDIMISVSVRMELVFDIGNFNSDNFMNK